MTPLAPDLGAHTEEQRALDGAFARRDQLLRALDARSEASDRQAQSHRWPGEGACTRPTAAEAAAGAVDDLRRESVRTCRSQLLHAEEGLVFGRLFHVDGPSRAIGRIGLSHPADPHEPLVLDWRTPAARPFYTATPLHPQGCEMRRHIRTRAREVVELDDEPLAATSAVGLVGGGALLASLEERRSAHMGTAVATLQREQDDIVRADARGTLVVQGGPGTGKTVVALHRTAFLLFSFPEIAATGVLMLGPSTRFLDYISHVLPALGETAVVAATCDTLIPGVRAGRAESRDVASAKGRAEWYESLAARVDLKVPSPTPLPLWVDGDEYVIDRGTVQRLLLSARSERSYLAARRSFCSDAADVLTELVSDRAVQMLVDVEEGFEDVLSRVDSSLARHDHRPVTWEDSGSLVDGTLTEHEVDRLRERLGCDSELIGLLHSWWPPLDPQDELRQILTDPTLLQQTAPFLTTAERRGILADSVSSAEGWQWSASDIALLDALYDLIEDAAPPPAEETFLAESARSSRGWLYGHVVVDEAQELSHMQWHMVVRRSIAMSVTAVGDIDQSESPHPHQTWEHALAPVLGSRWRQQQLSICYRTPAEVMNLTHPVLEAAGSSSQRPRAVRSSGITPWVTKATKDHLTTVILQLTRELETRWAGGTVGIITHADRLAELRARIGGSALVTPVLTPLEGKGLEWDAVLVVDPDGIMACPRGLSQLYVALTRCTQELGQVSVI